MHTHTHIHTLTHTHTHTNTGCTTYVDTLKRPQRKNVMLLCDGCDKGWHLGCVTSVKLNPDKKTPVVMPQTKTWFCPKCAQPCQGCDKLDVYDDAKKRLLQCHICEVSWHMHCLNRPLRVEPEQDWACPGCKSHQRVTRALSKQAGCGGCHGFISTGKKARECVLCNKLWHSRCLLKTQRVCGDEAGWYCPECSSVNQ